jgi:GMP synthase (glutamine-hydrolysing)
MTSHAAKISAGTVLRFPTGIRPAVGGCLAESLLPVLIVLHQETSTPGRIGNALRALGHPLDIRRPRFGDALPETLEGHAGAVIFGGPMSANDPDDFVRREIDWIAVPLREQRPFLGVCLGAQMLAMQLGARVAPHPQGRAEIGYYPIRPTLAGSGFVRIGPIKSITGTAKALGFPQVLNCWRKAATSRCRRSDRDTRSVSSFILM